MHSTGLVTLKVTPQFIKKLWKLVEDPTYDEQIYWGSNGTTFVIQNQSLFAKDVLPLYFKHNNIASFIRQLNMYGFSKVANIEHGGMKSEREDIEFQHDEGYFVKGQEQLIQLIKRKTPTGKGHEQKTASKNTELDQFLIDVTHLKIKHEHMENSFTNLKRENEVIWRELGSLRQKYAKQQQIINKMIQFLIGMVHSNANRVAPTKRKLPLMITEQGIKREKPSRHFSLEEGVQCNIQADSPATGPVIHDVTDTEGNDCQLVNQKDEDVANEISAVLQELVQPKQRETDNLSTDVTQDLLPDTRNRYDIPSTSTAVFSNDEPSAESIESSHAQSTIAIPTKTEIAEHVGSMQTELDSLRELLQSNFNFDASTYMELFNSDDSVFPSLFDDAEEKNEITGTEVVQYHPNLLDLSEDDANLFQVPKIDYNELEFGSGNECILPDLQTDNETLNTPDPNLANTYFSSKKPT
uniref:HSF-type DNA-binding domain-containing protein n=1 Tax=Strigamia maritima TaxID=126957 RepID=T1J4W2_STRMM